MKKYKHSSESTLKLEEGMYIVLSKTSEEFANFEEIPWHEDKGVTESPHRR